MNETEDTLRIDKWLWHARFFKSRTLAAKFVSAGHLRIDGATVSKAHFMIRPGHVLTFPLGNHIRIISVEKLGVRRGPAPEAQLLYHDLDPPELRVARSPETPLVPVRDAGAGRPTKKERRAIDRLRADSGVSD